jgi:hypothetical protein
LEPSTSPYLREVYAGAIGSRARIWLALVDGKPASKVVLHLRGPVRDLVRAGQLHL